jgi:hypothetical protein
MNIYVGFDILMATTVKNTFFRAVMPYRADSFIKIQEKYQNMS